MKPAQQTIQAHLQSLNRAILIAFIVLAVALIYWGVVRAGALLAREDNPRLVEAELRLVRGRIWDRHDRLLAETTGPADRRIRTYPIPNIGPGVGYYSFRHGTAGVEESFNPVLRGDTNNFWLNFWRQTLNQPQIGRDIRLTLDADWQQTADTLLGSRPGALLLLTLPDAAVRALVSHPGYNPNQLDENFDALTNDTRAPLLNRVTQGQYQPGLLLQPLLLAMAMERGLIDLDESVDNPNRPVAVNGNITRCAERPPEPATWADVLRYRCPAPLQALGEQLGVSGLAQVYAAFGLDRSPSLPLNTVTPANQPPTDVAQAAIGQENLTVTPLQVALALATLGSDGHLPVPQLVTAVQDETGAWQDIKAGGTIPEVVVNGQTAFTLRSALPRQDDILEHNVLVFSGPEGSTNGWYIGLTPAGAPRYLVVVVVEETADHEVAAQVGRELLRAISAVTPAE